MERRQFCIMLPAAPMLLACYEPQIRTRPEHIQPTGSTADVYFTQSHFRRKIPSSAIYTLEERIGSIGLSNEEWSEPIYRRAENPKLTRVRARNGSVSALWPIPKHVAPARETDHHLGVISFRDGKVYEFFNASWEKEGSEDILMASSFCAFDLYGDAIARPETQRVNAAGWSTMAGMVRLEDFSEYKNQVNIRINHALSLLLPFDLVQSNVFIPPAIRGERLGRNPDGVPVGAHFAFPREMNVELLNVHPLTKEMARAIRDFGAYVIDTNDSPLVEGKHSGAVRVEVGLIANKLGMPHNHMRDRVYSEMRELIRQYPLYRISQ